MQCVIGPRLFLCKLNRHYFNFGQSSGISPMLRNFEFRVARFLAVCATIAWTLSFPASSFADNCNCNLSCSHQGAAAMQGVRVNEYQMCMANCERFCPNAEQRPKSVFGAITYSFGDGIYSIGRQGPTVQSAAEITMKDCRANSKQPATCQLVSSYKDSCGALAKGSKGYLKLGDGGDTGKRLVAEAEANVMAACKRSGSTDCRIVASGCANDMTVEERAAGVARDAALLAGVGAVLKWGLESSVQRAVRPPSWEERIVNEHNAAVARNAPLNIDELPLTRQRVEPLSFVSMTGSELIQSPDDLNRVSIHFKERKLNEAKLLTCVYGSSLGADFWYETVPITKKELLQVFNLHPLRRLGDVALVSCPKTLADAHNVIR
jgi:hypothetical protein